jgi:DegV family protein with EDD domain
MVKIVCDSTSDLPIEIAGKYGISVVPLNVHFGTDTYQDGISISPEVFYKRLAANHVHPTTSAPAPGLYTELYEKLSRETDEILVLTISGGISATYESALQAINMVGGLSEIKVIDSRLTCGGLFLPALKAAQAAQQGAKLKEIASMVKDVLSRTHAYMIFDTLEYLQKGGRIGKAQALVGSLLKFNPIITMKDGVIAPVAKPRSRGKAKEALVEIVRKTPGIEEIILEDASTPVELEELADRIGAFFPREKIYRGKISPVIGVHTGPSVMAASFIGAK